MSGTIPYTLAAFKRGTTVIDQIVDQSVNINSQIQRMRSDGQADSRAVFLMGQTPQINFTTHGVASALAVTTWEGIAILAGDVGELYFTKHSDGAKRDAGSVHEKYTINQGILVPQSINASQGQLATMSMDMEVVFDGTNDPLVFTGNGAVPAGDPTEAYTVGPVAINGTLVHGIQSISVDFGISLQRHGGDGDKWATGISITSQEPVIRVTTTDITQLRTLGLTGVAQTLSDSKVFLRGADVAGGTVYADASLQHLQFAIDEGLIHVETNSAASDGQATSSIVIEPVFDGTADTVAISSGVAITA